jgi:hypothetical protein
MLDIFVGKALAIRALRQADAFAKCPIICLRVDSVKLFYRRAASDAYRHTRGKTGTKIESSVQTKRWLRKGIEKGEEVDSEVQMFQTFQSNSQASSIFARLELFFAINNQPAHRMDPSTNSASSTLHLENASACVFGFHISRQASIFPRYRRFLADCTATLAKAELALCLFWFEARARG